MSDEPKKIVSKFRTFAGDLEAQRKLRELAKPPKPAVSEHKHPTPLKKKEEKIVEPAPEPKKEKEVKKEPKIVVPSKKETPSKEKEEKKDAPVVHTKIPAFHELQKKSAKQKDDGSNDTETKRNIGYDSTVITDTKERDFKFIPSVITSIRSWFKKIVSLSKQKSTPKYSVPEADRRKGVIQRATSKTGTIFTADNETLKKQIRLRRSSLGPEDIETEANWSPYTEPGFNLLEAPESEHDSTKNVIVEFKKKAKPTTDKKPIQIVEPTNKTNVVPDVDLIEEEEKEAITPEPVKDIRPEIAPEETSDTSFIEVTTETPEITDVQTEVRSEPLAEERLSRSNRPRLRTRFGVIDTSDTNTLTVLIVVAVVTLIILIFAGRLLIQNLSDDTETIITQAVIEPVLQDSQLVSIVLTPDSKQQIPQLILTAITSAPDGIVELPILLPNEHEVPASLLFNELQFKSLPSLRESITTTRFVTLNQSDPILLIRFADTDTVRGGFLNWEENMATDMRPIYGIPTEAGKIFVDETINGIDVRSLKVNDETVLIYGFIDENTLLVAKNPTDLTNVAELKLTD